MSMYDDLLALVAKMPALPDDTWKVSSDLMEYFRRTGTLMPTDAPHTFGGVPVEENPFLPPWTAVRFSRRTGQPTGIYRGRPADADAVMRRSTTDKKSAQAQTDFTPQR